MSGKFKRFPYKSLREIKETEDKNVDIIASADGSVTVVKKEEIRKNYRNNKLIRNDEDSKIIQDFCRKHLHFTEKKEKEEKIEDDKKEQEAQNTSQRGYLSKYRRNFRKQQENENSNKSPENKNIINENTENNNNNQSEQNKEESNSGKKYYRRRFFKSSQNSNQNGSPEKDSSYHNKVNINAISSGKDKNEQEEINNSIRYKRKKYISEEKKEEEKKPKFVPTYHEKKKYIENDKQMDYSNLKNYKCQIIEAIPVKFFNDYDFSSRRFLSPVKPLYVYPYLNPDIIITKIKLDDNYIPQSNIGYVSGINNFSRNNNLYKNNISRNDNKNKNLFRREIFSSQYKTEYKYIHPFTNIDNSRNVYI